MFVYATFDTAGRRQRHAARRGNRAVDRLPRSSTPAAGQGRDDADRHVADQRRRRPSTTSSWRSPPTTRFEAVRERAQQALGRQAAASSRSRAPADDQLTTLYSNLYRLFLYPNSGFENTGTAAAPVYKHAVQSSTTTPAEHADRRPARRSSTARSTSTTASGTPTAPPGRRTRCSRRSMAGEMVDGFVQQYRDGGWISRWSSPGYANLMVGTSSDVAFADAYLKGVRNFDAAAAYEAAVKNATVAPPNQQRRPQGLRHVAVPRLHADGVHRRGDVLGDGRLHQRLRHRQHGQGAGGAGRPGDPRARYRRSTSTSSTGRRTTSTCSTRRSDFFQGRDAAGSWRLPPGEYDPRVWGFDYTETNGWNMAFHVPQDGQGLANLYGGRDELARQARRRSSPRRRRPTFPGSYGGIIHEMLRGPRRADGPVRPQQPAVAPHHLHVRLRRPAVEDAGEGARGAVPALPRQRDRPGLPGRRGQRRDVGVAHLQRARLLPAADGQPELRDRLAAVHQGDGEPGERQEDRRQRAEQQRDATSTCRA